MFGLEMKIEEIGSLSGELDAFKEKVNAQIPHALKLVGEEMADKLAQTIETEVYAKYTPYATRGDPYYRRVINDFPNSLVGQIQNNAPTVNGNVLTFVYNPHGYQYQVQDPAHGDELIRRIETGKGYSWRHVPPDRPFWTKFVEEQRDKHIMDYFILGMKPFEVVASGDDVQLDGSEFVSGTTVVLPF